MILRGKEIVKTNYEFTYIQLSGNRLIIKVYLCLNRTINADDDNNKNDYDNTLNQVELNRKRMVVGNSLK